MSREDTRARIIDTFRELACTRCLDKITVLDISEKCGITSQTFYNHFADKYELVNTIHNLRFDEVCDKVNRGELSWEEGLSDYLKGFSVFSKFIIKAYGNIGDENSYMQKVASHMVEKMCSSYEDRTGKSADEELLFAIRLYADGMLCAIYKWLKSENRVSEQELAKFIHIAIPRIVVEKFTE